jgi:type I restriction enzyme R subunit
MLACNKKVEAVKYYNIFKEEFPELDVAVVISSPDMREGEGSIDEDTNDIVKKFYLNAISNYKNEEEYEETIKSKFINGDIDILIVVDKLLTGFDAPRASTLYLDKQIKEHNLLQAIARVNRLCDGKDYGYIVDYRGLLGELDKALTMYEDAGLEEFEENDVKASVYYIDTEIDNMLQAYDDLKNVFKDIKNKDDLEEYEVYLADDEIRKDFYNKLCRFGSLLGLILPSDRGYYKVGKEKIIELRKSLAFYQKLRATVKRRYSETIDHKEYEAKMQKLLDNYVVAKEMMRITEPVDITDTDKFDKELEKMTSDRGKADTIRTRLTRTITEKAKEDPAYYKKFSVRIEETIDAYRNKRISDSEYLEKMQDIKEDFRKGNSGIAYPSNITTENARAFYGVIYDKLVPKMKENTNIEEVGNIAIAIQNEIESKIKRDWHYNTDIHNEIAQAIDDTIFIYATKKGILINIEELDQLIEEIINIALMKY